MCVAVCDGEVHVSHSGSDTSSCGASTQPCATLRFALLHHANASHITINSSGGAYLTEAGSHYLVVNRSVVLAGTGRGPAVIQCTDEQRSKLFHFIAAARQNITVEMKVIGCQCLSLPSQFRSLSLSLSLSV